MGLRRIGHSVELVDTPATRGMILKVRHLVTSVNLRSGIREYGGTSWTATTMTIGIESWI